MPAGPVTVNGCPASSLLDRDPSEAPMTTTSSTPDLAAIGARRIPEFDGVRDVWPRGERLAAVRAAGEAFKPRFKQGQVKAVRSVDIAAAPYPVAFAFNGAVTVPHSPLISMINRMIVVQYDDFDGVARTLVFEPTVPAGSAQAPFYANLQRLMDRLPGGNRIAELTVLRYYNEPEDVLRQLGLAPDDVDFCTFDHLHVQDPRMILGSTAVIPGETAPRAPLFGDARLLVQRREADTLRSLHPMQWAWYVEGGLDGVPEESLVYLDGAVELGPGVALLWTPGHTDGNHSLVLNTPDGVWVSSENGISLDNWQPELSRIPGVRRYAESFGREICPNANTLEDSLDQYDSMVAEKILADPCRDDPRWLQILPSTELVDWKRFWPVRPTYVHGGVSYGTITGSAA
jgi:hypothetical protein